VRLTHSFVQVVLALSEDPFGEHYGYDLSRRVHVRSGVMYPILRRMLEDGWLADGWQDLSETNGRPPRRYYTLTDKGRRELGAVLDSAREDARFLGLFGWSGA
jgi:PadR family transcriptional regulator PadR